MFRTFVVALIFVVLVYATLPADVVAHAATVAMQLVGR
jgi:hypothetical protein